MPPIETNAYDDLDTSAVAAEIGAELFSSSENPNVSTASAGDNDLSSDPPVVDKPAVAEPAGTPPVAADPNVPAVIPGENSVSQPLPKSWKKELEPEWAKMSPAVRAYVHEREAQVMRGINQYQQGYQAWDNLIKPFAPVLQANPDVNPIVLMQGLMATHLQFLNPDLPAAEKATMAKNLLVQYGINLEPGSAPQVDPAIIARLKKAEDLISSFQNTQRQNGVATFQKEVEAFSVLPENEHFNEVANDILRFIQNGSAQDLKSAYDLACWANPAVRAKLIAKQQSVIPPNLEKPRAKNGQFLNLEADGDVKPARVKIGSIDDTINAVVAKAYTKH